MGANPEPGSRAQGRSGSAAGQGQGSVQGAGPRDSRLLQPCRAVPCCAIPRQELSSPSFQAELRLTFLTWAGCPKFLCQGWFPHAPRFVGPLLCYSWPGSTGTSTPTPGEPGITWVPLLQVLFLRGPPGRGTPGHLHRQELRQIRHRGARAGPRHRVLARAHAP